MVDNRYSFSPLRTLLTTGLTAAAMHARANPGIPRATPELMITYDPGDYPASFSLNNG